MSGFFLELVGTTPAGDSHISLNGGWPIVQDAKGNEYIYKISFEDANDHVLWGKLSPFTSDNANTETGTVKWESSKTPIASGFKNAAFIESGKEVTLDFKAEDDGILYIKWANKPSSGTTCNGGGTIKLSKIVKQIVIDE